MFSAIVRRLLEQSLWDSKELVCHLHWSCRFFKCK